MEIQLLGAPTVRSGSLARVVAGRQGAVLAALALSARRPVSLDRLADVVWGDQPPGEVANALQQRMSRLRGVVDPERRGDLVVQVSGGYALHVDDGDIDARRFEDLAATGSRQLADGDLHGAEVTFTQALGLWRGAALEGFADEPWAMGEARRLEELRLAVTEDRFEALLGQGAHDRVVGDLVDLTVAHPLRERLRGQLMLALYRVGRQGEALTVYDETRRLLAEELGVDPGPRLQHIHRQILTQDGDLAADVPDTAVPAINGNLPAPRSSIVGREHALEQIAQLLDRVRLLTVTGPGGAGKTTLAVAAARRRDRPPGGVWLVSLAPVATGEAVAATIADVLGLSGGGLGAGTVDEAVVVRALAGRRLLLVLDNCEHLLDAVSPLVEQLLAAAPQVQILATSRERLTVKDEVVWSVPGLGVPEDEHTTADQVAAAPAVRLLVERARAHTPDFTVADDTAAAAATLTRRLDGIPLAIELAASRLRVLSVHEVVSALDDRFRVLAARGRTAASRHRTLRAALDWSWDLLTPSLQRGLAALAVPADRFDLDMVSELLRAAEVETDPLEVVADLVDRSLLLADTTAVPTQYRMLESIRDYGRARHSELDLADAVHTAHADAVEAALATCHSRLSAAYFGVDVDGLGAWLDDARVALRWAHRRGDRRRVQRLAGWLGWLWLLRGLSVEGLGWLDRGLGPPGDVDPDADDASALLWASALRAAGTHTPDGRRWAKPAVHAASTAIDLVLARVCAAGHEVNAGNIEEAFAALDEAVGDAEALGGWPLGFVRLIAGQLASASGHVEQARRDAEDAVALLGAAHADWAQTHALETLIDDAIAHGDYGHARDLAEQALQLCRRRHYPELEAAMLTKLGLATHELGDDDAAARLLDEAVAHAAAVGSGGALVEAHIGAGSAARRRGHLGLARTHLHEALELSERHAVLDGARVHVELAHTARNAAEPDVAAAHAGDALVLARQVGDPRTMVRSAEALAGALAGGDDPDRAVPLLATAAAVRDAGSIPPSPAEQRDIEHVAERLRCRVTPGTFDRLWAAAQTPAADQPLSTLQDLVDAHTSGLDG